MSDRIDNAAALPTKMPHAGREGRVAGTRELVIPRTPDILIYRIQSKSVRVLSIYRGARRWPARFE